MRVLLVSNVGPGDPGGRAEKLTSRADLMAERGVETVFGTVPEPYVRTFLPRILTLARRGRREDVDAVVSVSNPFHLQLVGYAVSRLVGVPWVVEFRDPMVASPDRDPDALLTKVAAAVERLAVTHSALVVWGDGSQIPDGYYVDRYDVDEKRVHKLPFHGYDPAAFEGVDPVEYDQFTVTYAGSFYDGWIEPYAFIEGLERFVDEGRDLRVQFYGDWNEDYQRAVEDAGIEDIVETHEFVPHEEVVPVLKGSDAVLYVGGTDPQNRRNVPSKIWDYVGARTPILAVVDPAFRVADLIHQHDLGLVVDPRNPTEIADALERMYEGEYEYDPPQSTFERFTRDRKVEAYADLLCDLDPSPS
ncbi:MAG: glycosyltransferase [Haloarculaceae archaeon]